MECTLAMPPALFLSITVYDLAGLSSEEAAIIVSLASIPRFTAEVYLVPSWINTYTIQMSSE